MPKIIYKEETLNGIATLVKYNHREEFYLRIKKEGKKYKNISLKTSDLDVARKNAMNAYMISHNQPTKTRQSKYLLETACEKYLEEKQELVDIGKLSQNSVDAYRGRIFERILPYAHAIGVKKVSDIDKKTWKDNYFIFYRKVKEKGKWKKETKGLAISTINNDISTIKELLKWMIDEECIDPRKVVMPVEETDDRNKRDESNPAYFPDEWDKFKKQLSAWEKQHSAKEVGVNYSWDNFDDEENKWKATWFFQYLMFQYHLGSRPHETEMIRVRDTEFKTLDSGQLKGIVKISPLSKRGKRTSVMNAFALQKVINHLKKGIKIRNKQINSFNKMIDSKFSQMPIEKLCRRYKRINPETRMCDLHAPLSSDDVIMMNPFRESSKHQTLSVGTIHNWYKEVLAECNFSENYTIYSLRSTHITHAIQRGIRENKSTSSIKILIGDNCGTSDKEIDDTYRRLNTMLNVDLLGFHEDKKILLKTDKIDIQFTPEIDDETFDYLRN